MSIKKVMYAIFFTNQGPAVQNVVPKGKSVNARFYKGNVLHRLKKYFLSRRPATGLRGVRLLHDNASSHKAATVREYLKQENVVELPHPPYSPELAPAHVTRSSKKKKKKKKKKIPRWKKISNAQKSRFGYFSASEQYTSKRL